MWFNSHHFAVFINAYQFLKNIILNLLLYVGDIRVFTHWFGVREESKLVLNQSIY